jgi:putative transcription antitermination factor YqgF
MENTRKNLGLLDLQVQQEEDEIQPSFFTPVLAIDFGEKFSGLALSRDGLLALPLEVTQTKDLLQIIPEVLCREKILYLIFGLPLSSDNSENHVCQKVRKFAKKLEKSLHILHNLEKIPQIPQIFFINERHSSQVIVSTKNKERVDDLAAVKILEYFWQSKKHKHV